MRKTTRTFSLKFFVNIVNDSLIFKIFEIFSRLFSKVKSNFKPFKKSNYTVYSNKIFKLTCKFSLLARIRG